MKNITKWIVLCGLLIITAGKATTLLIPERQGPPGSLVRVDLAVNGADSLAGLELVLQYDRTFLEFIRVESEGAAHDFLIVNTEKEDQIAIAMARPEAIGEPYAVICGLTFRIRQSVEIGKSTEITWQTTRLFSVATASIAHDVIHGVVRVRDIALYPCPFTPDGNGINDIVYFVLPEEMMPTAVVKIFSVGGQAIRELGGEGRDYLTWDGRDMNGQLAKPGVYLYLLVVNGEPLRKGTVTLML